MPFCTECANKIEKTDNFCAKCGKATTNNLPKTKTDSRICINCGHRMHSDQYYCCNKKKPEPQIHPDDRYL